MANPRILTDIEIGQSPLWCERTEYLFQGGGPGGGRGGGRRPLDSLFRLLRQREAYDVVVTADIRTAQLFGLARTLLRWKRPKHIVLELMLDEARDDWRWQLKNRLQRLCFSSVEVIFVSSRRETETYSGRLGLPRDRVRFLPFHTNVVEPGIVDGTGGYLFSAGKTGRDYATLAAAVKDLPVRVVVVSDRYHLEGVRFPPNVEVHCDIPYRRYLDLLHGCRMVVVPLRKVVKSTGQVVFLEAMALGKPVIATLATGTEDYIEHGVTGLLVPPEDCGALRRSIELLLADPALSAAIAARALDAVTKKHSFDVYTRSVLAAAAAIAEGGGC